MMREDMPVFEKATRELQLMHSSGNLGDLGRVSGDYYWAAREIEKLRRELAAALSPEAVEKLTNLQDCFAFQESIAGDIFYNQGFSDGISFIMQSLMWESVRR